MPCNGAHRIAQRSPSRAWPFCADQGLIELPGRSPIVVVHVHREADVSSAVATVTTVQRFAADGDTTGRSDRSAYRAIAFKSIIAVIIEMAVKESSPTVTTTA